MRPRLILCGVLPLVLAACLSDDERQTIDGWLMCEDDCQPRQEGVADIGVEAIPRLGGALYGPPPHLIRNVRRQAERVFGRLSPAPAETDVTAYATRAEQNFRAQYQSAAATSLGEIGRKGGISCLIGSCKDKATTELRDAFVRDSIQRETSGTGFYRVDVLDVIRDELESLGETTELPVFRVVINITTVNLATGAPYGDLDAVTVSTGVTLDLEALVFDSGGRLLSATPAPVWTSSDAAVATISGFDLSALSSGTSVITVTIPTGAPNPPEDTLKVTVPIR